MCSKRKRLAVSFRRPPPTLRPVATTPANGQIVRPPTTASSQHQHQHPHHSTTTTTSSTTTTSDNASHCVGPVVARVLGVGPAAAPTTAPLATRATAMNGRYNKDGSSFTEVVLCRHTAQATVVTSPARPDIEFEAPRASDALQSFHAFRDALNEAARRQRNSGGNGNSNGERRRKHAKSSTHVLFPIGGLLFTVGQILNQSEKAKCEPKDRKPAKTTADIFGGSGGKKSAPDCGHYYPFSVKIGTSAGTVSPAIAVPKPNKSKAQHQTTPYHDQPQQTVPQAFSAPITGPTVAAAAMAKVATLGGSAAKSLPTTDEKSNKENMKPNSASSSSVSSASTAASAELAAESEMARLSPEEEQLLADARAYFDEKVDGDGALVLNRDDINPSKWKALALYLTCTSHVSSLRLQNVDIDAEAARVLSASRRFNTTLRHVTLCANGIGAINNSNSDECLKGLVDFLLRCLLLESLAVLRNSVRDEHIPAIQKLLVHHRSLVRLSLCWNGITDLGATAIAKALDTYQSQLTAFDLSWNSIGESGRAYVNHCAAQHNQAIGAGAYRFFPGYSASGGGGVGGGGSTRGPVRFNLEHNRPRPFWLTQHRTDIAAVG